MNFMVAFVLTIIIDQFRESGDDKRNSADKT